MISSKYFFYCKDKLANIVMDTTYVQLKRDIRLFVNCSHLTNVTMYFCDGEGWGGVGLSLFISIKLALNGLLWWCISKLSHTKKSWNAARWRTKPEEGVIVEKHCSFLATLKHRWWYLYWRHLKGWNNDMPICRRQYWFCLFISTRAIILMFLLFNNILIYYRALNKNRSLVTSIHAIAIRAHALCV